MVSLLSLSSLPLPRTLPKSHKTLIVENSISPSKSSHFKKPKSSQIPSSLSENRAFPVPAAEIPPDFAPGTAFLSSILAVLVWILESRRKQRLLLPHQMITRRCRDLRRGNVVVGSWKLRLDVFPSIRGDHDRPSAVIDPAFLGIEKAAELVAFRSLESDDGSEVVENAAHIGVVKSEDRVASGFSGSEVSFGLPTMAANPGFLGIVKSADPVAAGIQKSYLHPEVVIDSPFGGIVKLADRLTFWIWKSYDHPKVDIYLAWLGISRFSDLVSFGSSDCRNCRALVPVNISLKQLVDSSGTGGVGLDESRGSRSVRNQLMLPVGTATCLETAEIPLPSAIPVTKDKLPGQRELKAVIPAIAMAAGAFGAVTAGVNGGLEMIGFAAVINFLVHDLLWASNRRMLWKDLLKVKDRETLVFFLKSRNIMTTD